MLAVWADHRDRAATLRLRESVHRVLNLPRNAPLEFKRHGNYAPPAHAGGGCIRYSIGQLLAAKAVTGPPPIYCSCRSLCLRRRAKPAAARRRRIRRAHQARRRTWRVTRRLPTRQDLRG